MKLLNRVRKDYNRNVENPIHSMNIQPAGTEMSLQMRIIRAVASSTAIETGQPVKELEAFLKAQTSKFQQLSLAAA
ncbi:hypothetical protein ERD78_12865 [Allopusillimonas soli]|uniref:Uncharacterized protein n=1 Tax=Allopusillimonas soli TaxID=659016 RepID=A0A853FDG8_9BURK|nr:hypothetical protein [Allopusillimonas soli]NYT37768.1 hypothetical protein [Allopusillimonas soli]TEA73683.1 hypothetical protein ERD78_12865 [Allopusillimonas soli]